MRGYLSYFRLRCLTNFQYRSAAFAGVFTQFFFGLIIIMVYVAFYESNNNSNAPMELSNLVTYIWLQQAFFALIYSFERDPELVNMITNGDIAYELIRPQNFYLKWYIKLYSKKAISVLLRFLPIISIGFILPEPYNISFPASFNAFLLFLIALILASFLVSAILMLFYMITMFTIDFKGVFAMFGVIMEIFMGGTIPIPFLPKWMQVITYKLPFRFVGDFPFRVYSGDIGISEAISSLGGSFCWILIIVLFEVILSKVALRRAVIQGG